MDILYNYAIKNNYSPKHLEDAYFSSPEEEQLKFLELVMQSGGENMSAERQLMQQEGEGNGGMVMQIIQMFAQVTEQDPTAILEQLQEMSPEEQEQAIQQMAATLQEQQPQMQMGGSVDEFDAMLSDLIIKYAQKTEQVPEDVFRQYNEMSEEEQTMFLEEMQKTATQMQTGGYDDVSMRGYKDGSPYGHYDSLPINSNILTMRETGIPLIGVGNQSGEMQYMEPYSEDYYFPNDEDVTEYPVYQRGKTILSAYDKFKKPFVAGSAVSAPAFVPGKSEDSMFEDFVEIFDPTGISSYDDIYREYQRYKAGQGSGLSLGLEVLGGLPLIGKAGKLIKGGYKATPAILKALNKGSKWADAIGDTVSVAGIAGGAIGTMKEGGPGPSYYERLLQNQDVKDLITLRANRKVGYGGDAKKLQELESKYGRDLDKAQKHFDRAQRKNIKTAEVKYTTPKVEKSKFTREEVGEYNKLLAEERKIAKAKALADEAELEKLIAEENRVKEAKARIDKSRPVKSKLKTEPIDPSLYGSPIPTTKRPDAALKGALKGGTIKGKKPLVIPDADLDKYGTKGIFYQENMGPLKKPYLSAKESGKIIAKDASKFIPGKSKLEKIAALTTGLGAITYGLYDGGAFDSEDSPDTVSKTKGVARDWFTDGSPVVKLAPGQVKVKGSSSGKDFILTKASNGTYFDESGKRWDQTPNGGFVISKSSGSTANNTPPPNRGSGSGGRDKGKAKETPKTKFPNFDLTFLQKPYYGEATDADVLNDIKSVPGIFDAPETTKTQRANMVGMGPEKGNGIQYSPKIEGITPERPKPNPRFKLNTTNRLSSLFNLGRVTDGWAPISPGYYKDVDIRLPELMQYDPSAGLQTIADTYDPIINNISNDTAGIAAKSSFASKKADAQQKYVNSIEQQNMGLRNQYNTMMADLYYKVNASRQENAANYFDNIQQALANRALLKDKTKAGLEQSFAAEQFANTKIDNTVMENEGVVEVTKPLDFLLGRRILDVDREGLNKKYLKVEEDKKTQEELLASVKMLLQQQKDQKATKLT
jgi:hypothetical protein